MDVSDDENDGLLEHRFEIVLTIFISSNGILCRLNVNNHLSYVDVHKNIETYRSLKDYKI